MTFKVISDVVKLLNDYDDDDDHNNDNDSDNVILILYYCMHFCVWPIGVVVRALDLCFNGCRFDARLFHSRVTTLGRFFSVVTKQYKLVPVEVR